MNSRRRRSCGIAAVVCVLFLLRPSGVVAQVEPGDIITANNPWKVQPGDVITANNWWKVSALVSPGNLVLVRQGMELKIVPSGRIDWPPRYKLATEQYSAQVRRNEQGELLNYVAGLPFPLIDLKDPQAATKIVWNFSHGPQFSDQGAIRNVETSCYRNLGRPGTLYHSLFPAEFYHSTLGHISWYNNVGRSEVLPVPSDPNAGTTGIRYRFIMGPVIEPSEAHGTWFIRYRYLDPHKDDFVIDFAMGRLVSLDGSLVGTMDSNSYFGFAAKVEDYSYRLLGVAPMLASVHAESTPPPKCAYDDNRTVCPENWELRQLYVVEATPKRGGIRRILYIDSEGWFITASDLYDGEGSLWKTVIIFNAYRDRSLPSASESVFPFKRIFETAVVEEDIQSGFSDVSFLPGYEHDEREGWFIDSDSTTERAIAAETTSAVVGIIHAQPGSTR